MLSMDSKEKIILTHYQNLLRSRRFDEYDILGFLIFVRRHINIKTFPFILEFSNLIAHRKRSRGIVMDAIKNAIQSNYKLTEKDECDPNHKVGSIQAYCGISEQEWRNEWERLLKYFDIEFQTTLFMEISICIFSLAQNSEYEYTDKKNRRYTGKIELFLFSDGYLGLCTTEGTPYSCTICFAKIGPVISEKEIQGFPIYSPVETFRENGVLHLQEISGRLII